MLSSPRSEVYVERSGEDHILLSKPQLYYQALTSLSD